MDPTATPPAPEPEPLHLCASAELAEKGRAKVFDVLQYGQRATAFALRFEGELVGYLNRCLHVPTEMDWQPGEFLDSRQEFIICSVHGASYQVRSGRCASGPCGRGSLVRVPVSERDGQVYWYPSRDIQPAPSPDRGAPQSAQAPETP
jgi:nitrite reductase/ring-hydroxylating ferredoxin subunit